MSREGDAAEESALSKILAGRDLFEAFSPRRATKALLGELRRDPVTRAILEGSRLDQPSPASRDETDQSPETRPRWPPLSPGESTPDTLVMIVDYANGMTQEDIARKHDLHIQTVRKRLKAAGVVTRSRGNALTEQDLDEARGLLDAGLSARKVGRRLGVVHTTLLRVIGRADATPADENHHHAPRNE